MSWDDEEGFELEFIPEEMDEVEELAIILTTALATYDNYWDAERGYQYIWEKLHAHEDIDLDVIIDAVKGATAFKVEGDLH